MKDVGLASGHQKRSLEAKEAHRAPPGSQVISSGKKQTFRLGEGKPKIRAFNVHVSFSWWLLHWPPPPPRCASHSLLVLLASNCILKRRLCVLLRGHCLLMLRLQRDGNVGANIRLSLHHARYQSQKPSKCERNGFSCQRCLVCKLVKPSVATIDRTIDAKEMKWQVRKPQPVKHKIQQTHWKLELPNSQPTGTTQPFREWKTYCLTTRLYGQRYQAKVPVAYLLLARTACTHQLLKCWVSTAPSQPSPPGMRPGRRQQLQADPISSPCAQRCCPRSVHRCFTERHQSS